MTEQSPATSSATENTRTAKKATPSKSRLGLVFFVVIVALLSLIALAISAFLGYQGWLLRDQVNTLQTELATLRVLDQQPVIQQLVTEITQQQNNTQALEDSFNQRFQDWQTLFDKQRSLSERKRDDWYLHEVAYLMRTAATRLYLVHDIQTAIAALEQADLRLSELENPMYIQVRQQLSNDISALRTLAVPDVDGTLLQLERLRAIAAKMPTASAPLSPTNSEETQATDATSPAERGFQFANLLSLFGFSQNKTQETALTRRENAVFLYQIIQLEIESAKQALVRYAGNDFAAHIANITDLLDKHYQADNQFVIQALAQISSIQTVTVFPEYPDISISLNLLQSLLNRHTQGIDNMLERIDTPDDNAQNTENTDTTEPNATLAL